MTALLALPSVRADTPSPTYTGGYSIDYNSLYLWRGMADSRHSVAQPSLWVTHKNLTLSAWGNGTLTQAEGRRWNETDWTLADSSSWGKATLEGDFQVYTYPHQADAPSTAEATLKFSLPVGNVRVFTTQNFDVARYPGSIYAEIGISGTQTWRSVWTGDATATLGIGSARFNEVYLGQRKATLNMIGLDFGISRSFGEFTLRPHLTVTSLLDSALRRQAARPDLLGFGFSIERDW